MEQQVKQRLTPRNEEASALRELFESCVTKGQRKSQATFGRENGLGSASMISQYLHGHRSLSLRSGIRFAAGMGVDLRRFSPRLQEELDVVLSDLPQAQRSPARPPEYSTVRCVELQLKAGTHTYRTKQSEKVGAHIAFRNDWLVQRGYDSARLLAVEMNDDGMVPTLIRGDLVVINTAETNPIETSVFAVNYEGEMRIRRLVRDAGEWWLYCDNRDRHHFPRKQLQFKHCYIIGRIVHRQSEAI